MHYYRPPRALGGRLSSPQGRSTRFVEACHSSTPDAPRLQSDITCVSLTDPFWVLRYTSYPPAPLMCCFGAVWGRSRQLVRTVRTGTRKNALWEPGGETDRIYLLSLLTFFKKGKKVSKKDITDRFSAPFQRPVDSDRSYSTNGHTKWRIFGYSRPGRAQEAPPVCTERCLGLV